MQLKKELQFDFAYANQLVEQAGYLTGELQGNIIDAKAKRDIVLQLGRQCNIPVEDIWAVGDGANDLLMLAAAGLGVAFDAKPRVRQAAAAALHQADLSGLLTFME